MKFLVLATCGSQEQRKPFWNMEDLCWIKSAAFRIKTYGFMPSVIFHGPDLDSTRSAGAFAGAIDGIRFVVPTKNIDRGTTEWHKNFANAIFESEQAARQFLVPWESQKGNPVLSSLDVWKGNVGIVILPTGLDDVFAGLPENDSWGIGSTYLVHFGQRDVRQLTDPHDMAC